jgi:hypothetical protein
MQPRKTYTREGIDKDPGIETPALSCYLKGLNQKYNLKNKRKDFYGELNRAFYGNQHLSIKGGQPFLTLIKIFSLKQGE